MMEKIRRQDNRILEYIQKKVRCSFLDKVMPKITLLGKRRPYLAGDRRRFLARKTERPYGFMLVLALLLCLAVGNIALKPLIGRVRPAIKIRMWSCSSAVRTIFPPRPATPCHPLRPR